ncbi:Hypothetical protein ORPV_1072 [Orpheovirus IHUMI-LCC2]|uniref:F-box domain-containing protein n=1 Tax=Orpheovirus IHUMI-LCC2 TaxID=2023057 RepID=A0A2I2L636_9VIRU|nr:Hypothetical protein ORPV_1072 [Orpheovirus IHUMI-LCC2]SNW62976.1 Hypothetical protein ORPV_1072 [Orpheovirus IHUMI-LCC2]
MELFTLPNEILFHIFEYVINIKDINSFVCSHKDGYKVRDCITRISNNINDHKVLYLYPNLRIVDGIVNMIDCNIWKDTPCFNDIHSIQIELPMITKDDITNKYIYKYLENNCNIRNITFLSYINKFNKKTLVYKLSVIDNNLLINVKCKWDQFNLFKDYEYFYKIINLLMDNKIINSIKLSNIQNIDIIKYLFISKTKSISFNQYSQSIFNSYMNNPKSKHLFISSIQRLEKIVMIGKRLYEENTFNKSLSIFGSIIDIMYNDDIVCPDMKVFCFPVPSSKLEKCLKLFPNVKEMFLMHDNFNNELKCDEDLKLWVQSLILPPKVKAVEYCTRDTNYRCVYNPQGYLTHNNVIFGMCRLSDKYYFINK